MSLRQYDDTYSKGRVIHYGASKIDNVGVFSRSALVTIYIPMERRKMIFGYNWKIKQDVHYLTW